MSLTRVLSHLIIFLAICTQKILTSKPSSRINEGQTIREKRFLEGGKVQVDGFFGYSDAQKDDIDRYFREQNWRVIKAELKYLKHLEGSRHWRVPDPDYQFLQITRQILTQTCPVEEVSDLLIKAVARLFRYILSDRREPNLYGLTLTEQQKRDNIMDVLRICLNESVPYNFSKEYVPEKCHPPYKGMVIAQEPEQPGGGGGGGAGAGNSSETTAAPPPPTDAPTTAAGKRRRREGSESPTPNTVSPAPGGSSVPPGPPPDSGPEKKKLCTCRKTYRGVQVNETVNNTCTGLEGELAWSVRELDFISETIWKMFQFTHYHCAKYFAADGSGLSVFHERVERFFHADIILRWANPGPTGKKLWEYYFFAYDLPSFLRGLDTCVCSAKTHSEYTQPMKRPSIPTFRKKRDTLEVDIDESSESFPDLRLEEFEF